MLAEPHMLGTVAISKKEARQKYLIASIQAVVADNQKVSVRQYVQQRKKCDRQQKTHPSSMMSSDEREQKISNRMVGNNILHTSPKTWLLHTSM